MLFFCHDFLRCTLLPYFILIFLVQLNNYTVLINESADYWKLLSFQMYLRLANGLQQMGVKYCWMFFRLQLFLSSCGCGLIHILIPVIVNKTFSSLCSDIKAFAVACKQIAMLLPVLTDALTRESYILFHLQCNFFKW